MSVGLWAYTRTLLTSAAADAARVAANYDAAGAVDDREVADLLGDGVTGVDQIDPDLLVCGRRTAGDGRLHDGGARHRRAARRRDADHRGDRSLGQGDHRMTGDRRATALPSGRRRDARRVSELRSTPTLASPATTTGRAMIEVVFLAVLILIPTIYILASVMRIQAATFAVTQGARDAGRVMDSAPSISRRGRPGRGDRAHSR